MKELEDFGVVSWKDDSVFGFAAWSWTLLCPNLMLIIELLGTLAPLVSVTAVRTVSFSAYQSAKYKASSFIGAITGKEEPLIVVNKPGSVPDIGTVTCFGMAGAAAGAASTFIAC